jgi:cytochrome c biogenesis protein CcmG, thiol:disulfide interchange protein DsbE
MKHSIVFVAGLALVVALVLPGRVPALAAPAPAALAPGQAVPSIDFAGADGSKISLASLKGRVVLVDFWASWCGPCAAAFPAVEELFQDYRSRGFEVLAVNLDEKRQDAERFLADRPHAMTVVFDPRGASAKVFGLQAMPTSYLIGRDGTVRYVHTGYSPATAESYRREIEQLLGESRN